MKERKRETRRQTDRDREREGERERESWLEARERLLTIAIETERVMKRMVEHRGRGTERGRER